jgi:aryl-alcohol dehydrogenase-like predicted oxidoreductase
MEHRRLGLAPLRVTPLGLGLAALGRPGYLNLGHAADLEGRRGVSELERHAHAVLDAAWAAGIRYLDAARSYGRAESFLASWLLRRGIQPGEVTVGSKWGYVYTAGWRIDAEVHEVKDHSRRVLERQWGESLSTLGDHLDLYQIHSATLESGVLDDPAVLDALARIRDGGVLVGLSVSGPGQGETVRRALAVKRGGAPIFASVQATWNLLERSAEPALEEASAAGLGIIVKEALANGRLTARNRDPGGEPLRRILGREAARLDTSADALSIAAALARPWATVVLSGAATAEQLRSNVRALEVGWDEEAEAAAAPLREEPERYWRTRAALEWT